MPVKLFLVLLPAFIASSLRVSPHPARQQHQHGESPEPEQLGTVSFPVSCSESAQAGFQRGVALLHSFGYNAAAKQFGEAAKQEPACAMAYWGNAMSLYRQLWDRPSEADLQKGREFIQKAQAAGAKTERETGKQRKRLLPCWPDRSFKLSLTGRKRWAQAVGAGHLRDVPAARSAVEKYDGALEAVKKGPYAYVAEQMATNRDEAHSWLAFAEGNGAKAIQLLQPVADKQDKVGKGEVEIPARETLADMLLELHQPQEALVQYRLSLKTDPNRFDSLYGAGRASELAQQPEAARSYYRQLLANCGNSSEEERPELAHLKEYLHLPKQN